MIELFSVMLAAVFITACTQKMSGLEFSKVINVKSSKTNKNVCRSWMKTLCVIMLRQVLRIVTLTAHNKI